MGLVASSNALRLNPFGMHVKASIDPPMWFLAPKEDVRSTYALEDAGTEFDVQGLELDWVGVCWDANLRHKATAGTLTGSMGLSGCQSPIRRALHIC